MRWLTITVSLLLAFGACSKDKPKEKPAPATTSTGTVAADGVRTIKIEAGPEGYVPDKIPGKPGEKLKLVFTRTVDGECLAELRTPDKKVIALPKNSPIEVAVTMPETGELTFACGMDMFRGSLVVTDS